MAAFGGATELYVMFIEAFRKAKWILLEAKGAAA
jgi:hypothetical protein